MAKNTMFIFHFYLPPVCFPLGYKQEAQRKQLSRLISQDRSKPYSFLSACLAGSLAEVLCTVGAPLPYAAIKKRYSKRRPYLNMQSLILYTVPYVGIIRIRLWVEASASSQPFPAPLFYHDKMLPRFKGNCNAVFSES